MTMGRVGSFVVMPSDVAALQKQIKADLEAVRASLQRCADAGTFSPDKTPVEWNAWQSMKTRAEAFVAETPSFLSSANQYERGELVQKELAGWHDKAKALGCDAGPAPTLAPPSSFDLSTLFGGVSTAALLVLAVLLLKSHK
jgi:hypothetical protein